MSVHFEKVVIVGVGLIGASLALAARKQGLFGEVVGVGRSRANLETAMKIGALDRYFQDAEQACKDADLVVLATPVDRILAIGKTIAPFLGKGVCVTDVGSVKHELVLGLEAAMPDGAMFVGGHPIAGSEESGAAAARPNLFEGAKTVLTPTDSTDPEALTKVRSLWEGVGSTVFEMGAEEHDALLAAVSHVPHMVAYALVNLLVEMEKARPDVASFAAGGFRDTTRIAASHPEMWVEICRMNRKDIVQMIESYEKSLGLIKQKIQEGKFADLHRVFEQAREFRNRL